MSITEMTLTNVEPSAARFRVALDIELLSRIHERPNGAQTIAEVERLRHSLQAQGATEQSSLRVVAMMLRYAILLGGADSPSQSALWRMHFVDRVPLDLICTLTWWQVRLYLHEIVITAGTSTTYFALSPGTVRMLRVLHDRSLAASGHDSLESNRVFRQSDGNPWTVSTLEQIAAYLRPHRRCV